MISYKQEQAINDRANRLTNDFLQRIKYLQGMPKYEQEKMLCEIGIQSGGLEEIDHIISKVNQLQFDHIYLVYKFIETPLNILSTGLAKLSEEDRRNYYKNVAKLIHPDKNTHPKAKEAFQKIRAALANFSNM